MATDAVMEESLTVNAANVEKQNEKRIKFYFIFGGA